MKQLILDLAWAPLPAFAGFMPGENAAVVAQLREQDWPGAPIYLWGTAGSGKTQLLLELQARAQADRLVSQWFDDTTPLPWILADDTALVLLDGAQAWDAPRQHAAFTLFVEAASRVGAVSRLVGSEIGAPALVAEPPPPGARLGVQFASAGRLPPVDLEVREDLRTRLGWGAVYAVRPLAEGDTRVALQQEARRHGVILGDDVLDYLLTRFARDLKSLMQLLHRLDGFALAEKRAVTVPLLKRMLDQENARPPAGRPDPAHDASTAVSAPARAPSASLPPTA